MTDPIQVTSHGLAALEASTRRLVATQVGDIAQRFGGYLSGAVAAGQHTSALDLLSGADVHTALSGILTAAQDRVETALRAGWTAAVGLGRSSAGGALGETFAAYADTSYLDAVIADVRRAFNDVLGDLADRVRVAHDAVPAGQPDTTDQRVSAVSDAVNAAVRALGVRTAAAASVVVHRGFSDAQLDAYADYAARHPDVTVTKRWTVTSDNPCPVCAALNGTLISLPAGFDGSATNDPAAHLPGVYRDLTVPPRHPNCFPAGVVVSGPAATTAYARWFDGDLVEITTQSGRVLAGTPNHPVLTAHGWLPLGQLDEGADVVGDSGLQRMLSGDPDDHQQPIAIQQVAGALRRAGRVASVRMPVAPEDFHGDGTDSEVHIEWSDGTLRDRVEITQPFRQQLLVDTDPETSSLTGERAARLLLDRVAASTDGLMGGTGESSALLRAGACHASEHCCASTTHVDPRFGEDAGHGSPADTQLFGQTLDALAGFVALDQVVKVRRYPFSGHVYNIGTTGGWYIANGVVVHNCRCRLDMVVTPTT